MNPAPFFGLVFLFLAAGLMAYFTLLRGKLPRLFRPIPAFLRLRKEVGLAVEAGKRLHLSLGRGAITGPESAVGLAGLAAVDRVAQAASVSDKPPVATSGDASLSILSQDTLRSVYRSMGVEHSFNPSYGRLVGVTPFSYAAGTLPVVFDEDVSSSVLVGHFGSEAALIADATERKGGVAVGGSDDLPGMAVLYATAGEPLIGEEVFTAAAYLGGTQAHEASLLSMDVLRYVVILLIVLGAVLVFLGLDNVIAGMLSGL
jgi:hypothetical protein